MLTRSEKTYLILTLVFLAAGSGIKAWRRSTISLGPFPEVTTLALDSARSASVSDTLRAGGSDSGAVQNSMADGSAFPIGIVTESAPAVNDSSTKSTRRNPAARAKAFADTVKVDLNRADAAALGRVKGIGPKTAQAIIEHRHSHGAFRDLRDLLMVKGIGEKKLEKLTPYLIL